MLAPLALHSRFIPLSYFSFGSCGCFMRKKIFMKFYKENEYRNRCDALFLKYELAISELLPHARIEHVGSSSISDALSKGDLDIFIGVEPEMLEDSVKILKTLNFREKIETLRTSELCMLESASENVALQVVANESEFEFFIEFREKLRHSKELLNQYNQLKLNCTHVSEEQYRSLKSEFIKNVLQKA